jgi:hypothetical protein
MEQPFLIDEVRPPAPNISLADVIAFIKASEWRFASTMKWNPHWYTVRPNYVRGMVYFPNPRPPAEQRFADVVQYIQALGQRRIWKGTRSFVHIDVDGLTYWTMGSPAEETWIINRKPL